MYLRSCRHPRPNSMHVSCLGHAEYLIDKKKIPTVRGTLLGTLENARHLSSSSFLSLRRVDHQKPHHLVIKGSVGLLVKLSISI